MCTLCSVTSLNNVDISLLLKLCNQVLKEFQFTLTFVHNQFVDF